MQKRHHKILFFWQDQKLKKMFFSREQRETKKIKSPLTPSSYRIFDNKYYSEELPLATTNDNALLKDHVVLKLSKSQTSAKAALPYLHR